MIPYECPCVDTTRINHGAMPATEESAEEVCIYCIAILLAMPDVVL